ncbi:superoxide dismutase [Neobacillus sp. PS3-40]|uniref:superoxide dismutase n=1 Tax=Neobacillus sp. PS3-40 TaxID=3070679 RepID=UPI0027E21561|nr:superoxide dismutase [Neobacillus sp. PS3-40]WML45165.1 superoxide dismutase [Neobacillus sp. PS3-40]
MDRFGKYVKELFEWNEDMKKFLGSDKVDKNFALWEKLDNFTDLMESISTPLSDTELLNLQSEAETIHEEMEEYFNRKQELGVIWIAESVVPPGSHTLPDLPYPYNALEPYISEEIMKVHHDKHHYSYVEGLNKAELRMVEAREKSDFSLVKHWSRELAFHGSGHYLHTIFWENMGPRGEERPKRRLEKEIKSYFGSYEAFKKHFSEAAIQVEGSGWVLLVWSPRSRHLEIVQSEKHSGQALWDTIPILVLDVWEHAYYLQYKNNRAAYVENWWKIVNWSNVEMRFEKAVELKWNSF